MSTLPESASPSEAAQSASHPTVVDAPAPIPAEPVAARKLTVPAAMAPLVQAPPLDHRIWVLAVVRFIVTAGSAAVMPFLAMYLAVDRQVPVLRIAALWATSSAVSAAMQWVAGQLGDRIGRRPVLVGGMLLRSVNLFIMGYAIAAHASFFVIALLAVVNGALRAFYDPVAWAVVASLSRRDERVAAFSLHRVGSSMGWVAGPAVATLAAEAHFATLFYVMAPVSLIAPVLALMIPETRPPRPARSPGLFDSLALGNDPQFIRFLFASLAYFMLQTQMYHLMTVYAAKYIGLGRSQVATLFTLNAVLVVVLQMPTARLIARLGNVRALVLGSLGYLVAYAACGLAWNYLSLLVSVAFISLCEILTAPAQQDRVTRMAPADKVARYGGAFGFVQGTAQTLGPVVGVFLLEAVSPKGAWFVLALLGPVAAWLYRAPERT